MASPESDLTPACSNCFFAVSTEDGLECRRYAPRPQLLEEEWEWPITYNEGWCGEFRMNAIQMPRYDWLQ